MMDINAGMIHWFIHFLIKRFPLVVLKVKLCQAKS